MNDFLLNGGLTLVLLILFLIGVAIALFIVQKKEDRMREPRGYFKINTCIKKEPKTIKPNFTPGPLRSEGNAQAIRLKKRKKAKDQG